MSACPPYAPISAQVLMPGQAGNPTPPQSQQPPGTPHAAGSGSPSAAGTPGMVSAAGLGGPSPVAGGPPPSHHVCCESGRPMLTDPLTGQTMCSCQYDAQLLNYQRLAASGLPLNMYGTAAAAAAAAAAAYGGDQGFLPLGASEQSAFYSPTANGFDLKENLEAWRTLQPYAASMYYPYESAALAGYPFANGYGVDLNGARRKNATRETTATLKAWLSEHRKNPYPTKGEKIMLAIITKMTLTQVSTWFANARRRLKKENKMTWSPRNRCDDDDDDEDARPSRDAKDGGSVASSGGKSTDGMDSVYRKPPGSHDPADMPGLHRQYNPHSLHRKDDDRLKDDLDDIRNGLVDIDDDSKSSDPGLLRSMHHGGHHRLQGSSSQARSIRVSSNDKNPSSPSAASDGGSPVASDSESSQTSLLSPSTPVHDGRGSGGGSSSVTDIQSSANPKPRIWSIVDTATSGTPGGQNGIPVPASRAAVESLNSLQRARLDYLSTYQKQGVGAPSWYGTTAGGGAPPGTVPAGSFPLYACSPMVPSSGLPSGSPGTGAHASQLASSGPLNNGHHGNSVDSSQSAAAAAVAASLNRLRTVHGFGSANDPNAPGLQGGPGKSTASSFSFVTSRLHPTMTTSASSSGGSSSSNIAAVAGSLGINPMGSIASRVVS